MRSAVWVATMLPKRSSRPLSHPSSGVRTFHPQMLALLMLLVARR